MSAEIVRAENALRPRALHPEFNQRIRDAYQEIEPLVLDVDRMAKIARGLAIEVAGTDSDLDLAQFAIVQLAEMTEHLVAEHNRLWDEARTA
jgi:hypothetical protein